MYGRKAIDSAEMAGSLIICRVAGRLIDGQPLYHHPLQRSAKPARLVIEFGVSQGYLLCGPENLNLRSFLRA
jgi:hypothetical protein